MAKEYDEQDCRERHENINERVEKVEQKVDVLCMNDAENRSEIKNLCQQIKWQTNAIWGLVMVVVAALVGFFFTK